MNRTDLWPLILLVLVGVGCSSSERMGNHCDLVEELVLLTSPSALNLDDQPGVDGFTARVYARCSHQATGMELRQGSLEIELHDGIHRSVSSNMTPQKVWSFTAQEMTKHRTESILGVGYFYQVSEVRLRLAFQLTSLFTLIYFVMLVLRG